MLLREEGDRKWQERADSIDARRPDPRSYYNAIRQMRQLRSGNKSPPVHLKDEGNNCLVPDTTWNLNKFSE